MTLLLSLFCFFLLPEASAESGSRPQYSLSLEACEKFASAKMTFEQIAVSEIKDTSGALALLFDYGLLDRKFARIIEMTVDTFHSEGPISSLPVKDIRGRAIRTAQTFENIHNDFDRFRNEVLAGYRSVSLQRAKIGDDQTLGIHTAAQLARLYAAIEEYPQSAVSLGFNQYLRYQLLGELTAKAPNQGWVSFFPIQYYLAVVWVAGGLAIAAGLSDVDALSLLPFLAAFHAVLALPPLLYDLVNNSIRRFKFAPILKAKKNWQAKTDVIALEFTEAFTIVTQSGSQVSDQGSKEPDLMQQAMPSIAYAGEEHRIQIAQAMDQLKDTRDEMKLRFQEWDASALEVIHVDGDGTLQQKAKLFEAVNDLHAFLVSGVGVLDNLKALTQALENYAAHMSELGEIAFETTRKEPDTLAAAKANLLYARVLSQETYVKNTREQILKLQVLHTTLNGLANTANALVTRGIRPSSAPNAWLSLASDFRLLLETVSL